MNRFQSLLVWWLKDLAKHTTLSTKKKKKREERVGMGGVIWDIDGTRKKWILIKAWVIIQSREEQSDRRV